MRAKDWSPLAVMIAALAIAGVFFLERGSSAAVYSLVAVAALCSLGFAVVLARTVRWSFRARRWVLMGNAVLWLAIAAFSGFVVKDFTPSTFFALIAGACSVLAAVLLSDGEQR